MKKKILLSMTLLAAMAAGSAAPTSHAAEIVAFRNITGECYNVYTGQGAGCLRQALKQLGAILGNNANFCITVDKPGNNPSTNNPSLNNPSTNKPDTCPTTTAVPTTATPKPAATSKPTFTPKPAATSKPTATPKPAATEKPNKPETDTTVPDTSTLSYAEQVVKLVNAERAKVGLSALTMQTNITAAANVRAKEIKQSFSHTRPNGSSFSSVLNEQGAAFRSSGENIAWGQKTPEQVMQGWMNSNGHRANILNKNFNNIGVGYYQDEKGVNYWVQLFTN